MIFFFIGIGLGLFLKYRVKNIYSSEFTIMADNGSGGGIGKYLQIASLMGLGGNSGSSMSPENMVDLLKSKRIVYEALFNETKFEGETVSLINLYIKLFGLPENFLEKNNISEFSIKSSSYDSLSKLEENFVNSVYKKMTREFLYLDNPKNSVLVYGDVVSENPIYAEEFSKVWIGTLDKYLSDNILNEEKKSVTLLENKKDSVAAVLLQKEAFFANKMDNSIFIKKSQGRLEQLQLQREIELLNVMYATTIQQLEMAKISLENGKNVFQIVDQPSMAFKVKNGKSFLFVGFLGIVLAIIRIAYLIYKESIVEQLKKVEQ